MIPLSVFDHFRVQAPGWWRAGDMGDDLAGAFEMRRNGVRLRVIATNGDGWDHVSVSTRKRCPTWEEMSWIAAQFFGEETAMQLHVPSEDHVNHHPYCLHWWRPHDVEIPRPHWAMVGPKSTAGRR